MTPYHSYPERFNCTIVDMLGTKTAEKKQYSSIHISVAVHGYNRTEDDATAYFPYMLTFEKKAKLPINLDFGICIYHTCDTIHS